MIYKVNAQLLEMLKFSDFTPNDRRTLEKIINIPKLSDSLNRFFDLFELWFNKVYETGGKRSGLLEIYSIFNDVFDYYNLLYVNGGSKTRSFIKMYNELNSIHDLYYNHTDKIVVSDNITHNLIEILRRVFCMGKDCVKPVRVKEDTSLEEIKEIYNKFIEVYSKLFTMIVSLESLIVKQNERDWEETILSPKMLPKYYSNEKFEIKEPSIIMISFCNDPSRLYYSTQKMVSTMVMKTNSHYSYGNRSFGFLYSFSTEDLVAMSYEDLFSASKDVHTISDLAESILNGEQSVDLTQNLISTAIDLMPLYDLKEMMDNTYDYNEILLKPETKAYGIFVWEEKLSDCFNQVCSLCTVFRIPLFICKEDGSMVVTDWRDVFNQAKRIDS